MRYFTRKLELVSDILYFVVEYNRTDISEGIDFNKTNASKEFDICHCFYFLDKSFMYEPYLCNSQHDLKQKVMNFNDFFIVYENK